MMQGDYLSVLEVRDHAEFREVVVRFADKLGFSTVAAIAVVDGVGGKSEFISVEKNAPGYAEIYEDPTVGPRDPVMQHCKRNHVPIIWSQQTYLASNAIDLWERQAQYGYRHGIAAALHLPHGRHFVLAVDRDQALTTHAQELTRITAELQLFAVYAQETAWRVFDVPAAPHGHGPRLTHRELEVLRWTMDGHTALQVGDRLGITERTVHMHSRHATKKLGCASKHQAVLKAFRLGLIR
jgi:DNA-binding CsgD family transcriptional regulator